MQVEFKVLGGLSHKANVEESATVKEVKSQIASALNADSKTAILVFKGKLLKDDETMGGAKIVEGSTVHVVPRKAPAQNSSTPAPAASAATNTAPSAPSQPQANPFANGLPNLLGNLGEGGLGNLGALGGLGGLGGMPQGMPNPEMISKMMQDPQMQQMMQSMFSNPQLMVDMLQNNPMLRNLANSNPVIRDSLSNPEMLRSMFSPDALQSAMNMMSSTNLGDLPGLLGMAQPNADQADSRPPAEKYKDQVQLLKEMGFLEEEANLRALQHARGNLDDAISKLLEEGYGN